MPIWVISGRFPIRLAWFGLVLPALVLNYFGQGALILGDKTAIENPFFRLLPGWGLIPLVLLSTAATVIASQAVISGSFSLTRQAIQLGLLPQLDVFQTSVEARGQIYIPQVNWLLMAAVLALVLGFRSSSALASAYGFAVTGTMTLTTVLAGAVMRGIWRWRWPMIGFVLVPIMTVDLALFSSNSLKIPSGAWFPLVIGLVMFTIMSTWRTGRRLVLAKLASETMPLGDFLATCEEAPEARVSGTAVFLSSQRRAGATCTRAKSQAQQGAAPDGVACSRRDRQYSAGSRPGSDQVRAISATAFGRSTRISGSPRPRMCRGNYSAPKSRESISFTAKSPTSSAAPTSNRQPRPGMARWREHLYVFLSRLATRTPEFFRIPPDQVIELGAQVEI